MGGRGDISWSGEAGVLFERLRSFAAEVRDAARLGWWREEEVGKLADCWSGHWT